MNIGTWLRAGWILPLMLVLTALPSPAEAKNPQVNLNFYRPSLHPGDILAIQTSNQPGHLKVGGGLFLTWNSKPLSIQNPASNTSFAVVSNQYVADLFISLGLSDYFDLALGLPVFMYTTGSTSIAVPSLSRSNGAAVGDMRLAMKVSVFGKQRKKGFGVALAEELTFPSANPRYFNGDRLVSGTTTLIADYQKKGWNVSVNLGVRLRASASIPLPLGEVYKIGNELLIGAGLVVPFICGKLEGIGTMEYRGGMQSSGIQGAFGKYANSLEFLGGIRGRVGGVTLMMAAGGGALKGYGSSAYRVTAGVSYEPPISRGCTADTDKDGIPDDTDKCPKLAGPAELQGCPDRDRDGIIDPEDRCPDVPGKKEFYGCPDTDNDGIEDTKDRCPNDPGPAKFEGCPDTDTDGVPDYIDRCPKVFGKIELEGCPDRDNDGIPDDKDKCPDMPGTLEFEGCPPPTPVNIKLTAEKIEILEMVFFETDKAVIKKASFGILDDVSKVLRDNVFIKKLRVEGHSDVTGQAQKNLVLSQKRAESVREYLINQGVAADRLVAEGFGQTRPIADNTTKEGKAKNRRVEFVITEK